MLVPDADIEQCMRGLLTRTDSLGIAPVEFEVTRHTNRDNGCRAQAARHLRPFLSSFRYALVVFDREGCGSQHSRLDIQQEVELDLTRNGWRDRSKAIVIDPEIEVWVWSDSPEVARVLGWGSDFRDLRAWLTSRRLWLSERRKPQDPKTAMRMAMEEAGIRRTGDDVRRRRRRTARRSPSKFRELATTVDFSGCSDSAFVELRRTLREWFPIDEAVR